MKSVFAGFKEFILRGNVMDLAVGVVIGSAFGKIVDGIVKGLINPLIAAIFGKPDLSKVLTFTIHGGEFSLGVILDAAFNFLCIAAAVYFCLILPMNKLAALRKPKEEAPEVAADVAVLQEIRDLLAAQSRPVGPPGQPGAHSYPSS